MNDEEEVEEDIWLVTGQRNHSTRTVNRAYANAMGGGFGNVWDGIVWQNMRASFLFQELWGVAALLSPSRKRRVGVSSGYNDVEPEDMVLGTETGTVGSKSRGSSPSFTSFSKSIWLHYLEAMSGLKLRRSSVGLAH